MKKIISYDKQKIKSLDDCLDRCCDDFRKKSDKKKVYRQFLVSYYILLIRLPYPFQPNHAQRWIDITGERIDDLFLPEKVICNEYEKKAYKYISEVSLVKADYASEINELINKIKNDKNEIRDIIVSKRFSYGRMLTAGNKRLSLNKFKKYI